MEEGKTLRSCDQCCLREKRNNLNAQMKSFHRGFAAPSKRLVASHAISGISHRDSSDN